MPTPYDPLVRLLAGPDTEAVADRDSYQVAQQGQDPDGGSWVMLDCPDYDALKKLPASVRFKGEVYGRTGWNSDKGLAYYKEGAPVATREAGRDLKAAIQLLAAPLDDDERDPALDEPVDVPADLLFRLEPWHGGQWSAIYSMTSSPNTITREIVQDARNELERVSFKTPDGEKEDELDGLVSELDAVLDGEWTEPV